MKPFQHLAFICCFFISIGLQAQCTTINSDVTNIDCFGSPTGSIVLTLSGGTLPYDFDLIDGNGIVTSHVGVGNSYTIIDLMAGTYSIVLTDADNCVSNAEVTILEPDPLEIAEQNTLPATCGTCSGFAEIIVSGGTQPYSYNWSPAVSNTNVMTDLCAGTYQVTVVDANACTIISTVSIGEESSLQMSATFIEDANCGECNGAVHLSTWGGTPPYIWDTNSFSGNESILEGATPYDFTYVGLCASVYGVSVVDANGCVAWIDFVIGEEVPLQTVFDIQSEPTCGACDGFVEFTAFGGVPPYNYQWNDGSLGNIHSDLCPGNYTVTVFDAVGCVELVEIEMSETASLDLDVNIITAPTCGGSCNGEGTVEATGGIPPYSYAWYDLQGNVLIPSLLCEGTYIVEAQDAMGCATTVEIEVQSQVLMEADITVTAESCMSEGMIIVESVTGGIAPYTYSLDGGITITSDNSFSNLIAGTYGVSIIDASNCVITEAVTINSPIDIYVNSTLAGCNDNDGTATVTATNGSSNFTYLWNTGATTATISNLAADWYSVTVTDNDSGCSLHQNVEVLLSADCFVTISGYVFDDNENEACLADGSVVPVNFAMLELSNGDFAFTDETGYYEFTSDPGTYTIQLVLNSELYDPLCTDPITVTLADFGNTAADNNFFLTYNEINNLCISVSYGPVRPGFNQHVNVHAYNFGNVPMGGTVQFQHDDLQEAVAANPMETSYDETSSTYTWDLEELAPFSGSNYNVTLYLDQTVSLGTSIHHEYTINANEEDAYPENNTRVLDLEVIGSFDPNDKAVTPKGEGDEGLILRADSVLNYLIRFQNTGTDTAFTVVVRDTLDQDLNIRTLVPGASSHAYTLNVIEDNILEFRFDNIMLPDSFVNEPASNGYFLYQIHTKENLEYGTTFENRAAIYFDFNEPVITNTVVNTLFMPLGLSPIVENNLELSAQPNPTNDLVYLSYDLKEATDIHINLYDINGQMITQLFKGQSMQEGKHKTQFSLASFSNGVYFVQVQTSNGWKGSTRVVKIE